MLGAMQMHNHNAARVVGVDVARAVALIGMFAAHLLYLDGVLAEVVYGFPSALFAFVSGISMALMAERGARPVHFVVRGALLLVLFGLLQLIPTDIIIVLGVLGACMVCLAAAPRFVAGGNDGAVALLIVGLTVVSGIGGGFDYSPAMWAALMLTGMWFHRHLLHHRTRLVWGAAIGLPVMAADIAARWYLYLPGFFAVDGHTGGVLDVVGSAGASIGICSLCCLVAQPWQVVLPRMGRMPLTLYCLHVATAGWIGFWTTLVGAAALATLWFAWQPRGPVEEGMRRLVAAGAGALERNNRETTTSHHRGGGDTAAADPGARDGERHLRR